MFKTLLVGLGKIGMGYDLNYDDLNIVNSHARAITLHEKFDLIGGVDINLEKRNIFKGFYKKNTYKTLKEAFSKSNPDIIVVASNSETHLENIQFICNSSNKIKAILCEKPLGTSLTDAIKIVNLCLKHEIKLYVNFIRRCDKSTEDILNKINKNIISLPIKGFCLYTKGFIHNGSHFFNLFEFWFGKMKNFKILSKNNNKDFTLIELDVKVEFINGTIYFLSGNEKKFSYSSFEFICDSGRLKYDFGGEQITWYSALNNTENSKTEELIPNDLNKYQYNVFNEIYKSLNGEYSSICTGEEALSNLNSMYKILKNK